ncbi:HAUS augmin-like complex subunit 3 [Patella vulgata]|uniref:HAUS augmin-like complex subunit 3 n=1 Tax=Patella vulgata TaxID=6465 RepID=UPI0024A89434|nr:HAUS augmin-like complex subunit 3 [Patella vulgata]
MSGRQILETLRQLGYPKVDELDPQMFDWLFEKESIVPFLDWFVNNVHSDNIITASDRQEYKDLESKSTEGLLDGRQLEDALKKMEVVNNETEITEESLSDDISRLRKELEMSKKKKETLIQRRNKLSVHHTSLSHKLTKLTPLESQAKKQYRQHQDQLQTDNIKVNESMDGLMKSVSRVTSLYNPATKGEGQHEEVFLSQVNLEDYYQTEEKYTQEITVFTRKQFFQNIGKMTGESEDSRFELLEIKDPESLLVHGENEANTVQDCKELNRLQHIYPLSETERVFSIVEDKSVKSAVNTASDLLNLLQSGNFPLDTNKLSTQLQETQSSLQTVRRDLSTLLEGDLPLLVKELAPLQGTHILTGDYNLKLARQDYFTSNQDKVIALLVNQRARNEFLTMAYEVEARHHRDIHRHLTAIRLQLQQHLKDWKNRMTVMDDPSLKASKYERGTIDTRDTATTRLHHILVDGDGVEKQLFLTYSSLLEGGDKLQQDHQDAYTAMLNTATKHYDKLHTLEDNVRICERSIYEGSSTTGQPVLSPPPVQDAIKNLDNMLKKLEATIVDSLRVINNKKTALKDDRLLSRERTFFVDFFMNPERINQAMEQVTNRIQSIQVQ